MLPSPSTRRSDDGVYEVYALRYGGVPERRVHQNFLSPDADMADGPMPLDFNLWIVRNAHRLILVDTGFGARAAAERRRPIDVDPVAALARMGIGTDQVADVVLTHMHFDHAGNIGAFRKARFHVQAAEAAFALGAGMAERKLRMHYDIEDSLALLRCTYAERVQYHEGTAAPFPGIGLHLLPGHCPGLQAVEVMTARGPVLLASDACLFYAHLARSSAPMVTLDVVGTLRSYRALIEIAGSVERIVPGHDPKVRALYPQRNLNGVEVTALHEQPRPHRMDELARIP